MNQFIAIPVVAGTGAGAGVDISCLSPEQTVIVAGTFTGALHIEVSDDNVNWGPLVDFTGPDSENFKTAVQWMRARSSGVSGAVVVFVAGNLICTIAVPLPVPAGNGVGAAVDISAMGLLKTIIVAGTFNASVGIQISDNGIDFVDLTQFSQPDRENLDSVARFARVRISGYTSGTPIVFIGGNPPEASSFAPPFATTTTTIYARLIGSDTLGNGTLANPYRTFQRAIRDVPYFTPPGARYIVDITGITEILPPDFHLPPWVTGFQFDFDLVDPLFQTLGPIHIRAVPQLIPADGIILDTDIASIASDLETNLVTITVGGPPRASWLANGVRGRFFIGTANFENCPIYESAGNEIKICLPFQPTPVPGSPFRIMKEGATLTGSVTTANFLDDINVTGFNTIIFEGIELVTGDPGNPFETSLNTWGGGLVTDLCSVESMFATDVSDSVFFNSSVMKNKIFFGGLLGAIDFVHSLIMDIPSWFLEGSTQFRPDGCVFERCAAVGFYSRRSDAPFAMDNTLVRDAIVDPVQILAGHGVILSDGDAILRNVRVENCLAHGIFVLDRAQVRLFNVHGAGNGEYGIVVAEGASVHVEDEATDITGAAGDMKVGVLGTRTWANFRAAGVVRNEYDIAAPPASSVQSSVAVAGATNAFPIEITTALAHGLKSGDPVTIAGVLGVVSANGVFTTGVVVTSPTTFEIGADGSLDPVYAGGGTVVSEDGGTSGSRLYQR